jgi:hypothetical protein
MQQFLGQPIPTSIYQPIDMSIVNSAITASGASSGLNITANVGGGAGTINLGANISTGGQRTYSGNVVLAGARYWIDFNRRRNINCGGARLVQAVN